MRKRKKSGILLVLLLGFIWGQSLMPRSVSAAESSWVTRFLAGILPFLAGREALVRKLAHLTEFLALGLCLESLLCPPRFGKGLKTYGRLAAAQGLGMLAAMLDETLQIFSKRGPLVKDVWIDSLGLLIGIASAALLRAARAKRRERKTSGAAAEQTAEGRKADAVEGSAADRPGRAASGSKKEAGKWGKWLIAVLLLAVLGFIWSQSLMGRAASSAESRRFTRFLTRLLPALRIQHDRVRKLAHLAEFFALGLCLERLLCPPRFGRGLRSLRPLAVTQGLGMLIALADETLQILSGRSSRIADVWIDSLGLLIGIVLPVLIRAAAARRKARVKERSASEE